MIIDKTIGNWHEPKDVGDESLNYQCDVIYQLYLNDNINNDNISSQASVLLYFYYNEKNIKYGITEYDIKYYLQSEKIIRKEKLERLKHE